MDDDDVWRAIDVERARVAALLASLSDDDWGRPSLCAGWTVRHVAAHLTLAPSATVGSTLVDLVRARGSFDRLVHDTAVRAAAQSPEALVAALRAIVGSRRLAPGQRLRDCLMDVLVHGHDIALPLGRAHPMPVDAVAVSLAHVWTRGFPFHASRRLRGVRLVATDSPWTAGDGPLVTGPSWALLLLATGRPAALPHLTGEGVAEVGRVCSRRVLRA